MGNSAELGELIQGFAVHTPSSDAVLQQQIYQSLSRGLPEALTKRTLTVVANGPSAKYADLPALHPTLALNGAIRLFTDRGLAPTFWACCDPQALVADFLPDDPPHSTNYLVASKCHPAVFEKLKGRKVNLWHLALDPVPHGPQRVAQAHTVTVSASWLMVRLGFNDFEYYGWDGCFMDGDSHATIKNDQPAETLHINYGGTPKDGEIVGGRNFPTTASWALESRSVNTFVQMARYFGLGVKIHGDGMFRASAEAILALPQETC